MTQAYPAIVKRRDARDLHVDVFPPSGDLAGAGVILLHGGGWMSGHRRDMAEQAGALAAAGFAAISAEYRLSPEVPWPAQLQDVFDIVAWARREAASLQIGSGRIALLGGSAGGHLALMAAAHVDAVVALCAPPELRLPPEKAGPNPIAALLGPAASNAAARDASPIAHVSADLPPICLIGGGQDGLVPPADLLAFADALAQGGVPVDLHIYHGHAHAFDLLPSVAPTVLGEIVLFLKRTIVDPQYYAQESKRLNPFADPEWRPGPPAAALAAGAL